MDRLADLRTRLVQIRMPSQALPAVAAAAVDDRALAALEDGVQQASRIMLEEIERERAALRRGPLGSSRALDAANQRLALLQIRADSLFKTLDLYTDATATRSDAEWGMLLAGTDRLVMAALDRRIPGYEPPRVLTYLDSATRGGAITRARTRLPGGVVLPVALVRTSPESLPTRLTSSLHEVGHQLAVDLNQLGEARQVMEEAAFSATRDRAVAALWGSFASELMADVWSLCLGGGAPAIDGLQRVLSLPAPLLFLVRSGDPHPPGVARVAFAISFARRVDPDPLIDGLEQRFGAVYGRARVPALMRRRMAQLTRAAAPVADVLARHRFTGLGGQTVAEVSDRETVNPVAVRRLLREREGLHPQRLASISPLLALAAISSARLLGQFGAAEHDALGRAWLHELARTRGGRRSLRGATPRDRFQTPSATRMAS